MNIRTTVIETLRSMVLTLGEDAADLWNFLAYIAWKEATNNQTLQSADGLTPDQRFFVGMGNGLAATSATKASGPTQSPIRIHRRNTASTAWSRTCPNSGAFACRAGYPGPYSAVQDLVVTCLGMRHILLVLHTEIVHQFRIESDELVYLDGPRFAYASNRQP
jgi:hypothetical protein